MLVIGLHFKRTNDAFSDGALMEWLVEVWLKNNYVYTQGAYFSDISGFVKLFYVHIHIHASASCILTSLIEMGSSHQP